VAGPQGVAGAQGATGAASYEPVNYVENSTFDTWPGAKSAPQPWFYQGAATVGTFTHRDGFGTVHGLPYVEMSPNGVATMEVAQQIGGSPPPYPNTNAAWVGRTVTFGAWVWCDVASRAFLFISGGSTPATPFGDISTYGKPCTVPKPSR
jgi:hypothetical protein